MKKLVLSIGFGAVLSLGLCVADGNSSFSFRVSRTEWNAYTGSKDASIQKYFTDDSKLSLVKVSSYFESLTKGDSMFVAPAPAKERTVNATTTKSWSALTGLVYLDGAQWYLLNRESDGLYSRSPFQNGGFDETSIETVTPRDTTSLLALGSGADQQVFNSSSVLFNYSGQWSVDETQKTRLPRGWEWKLDTNYTVYFFNSSHSNGMKVELGLTPKFETDLIAQYPGFQLTTAQIRLTLMAFFYGLTTAQSVPDSFTINVQLLSRLVSNETNAKNAYAAFKKYLWLALGVTGTKNDPSLQFPPAHILESVVNPGYAKVFYRFARELKVDPIRNAPYSDWVASGLKNQVLQYLVGIEGAEDSTNATVTAYKNWLTGAPTATFRDFSGVDVVSGNPPAIGPGGSTLRISFPPATGSRSPIVYVPSSPNLLTPERVLDFSGIAAYVRPRAGYETNYVTSDTLDITLTAATDVRSLVIWADKATVVNFFSKNSQGVWVPLPFSQKFVDQNISTGQVQLVASSTQKFPTRSIELNATIRASTFRLSFSGGKLFSMRMYSDPNSFSYSSKGDVSSLLVTPLNESRLNSVEAEVFWNGDETTSLPSIEPYFVELYGDQLYPRRPGNEFEFDGFHDLYHPIRFTRFGLESPWSYNKKVYNNSQWRVATVRTAPFTEMDLRKGSRLGDDWTYSQMNAPQYPPGKTENDIYPYTYGLTPSNKDGTSLQTDAPFFVEKMAGVDSTGLLLSTLLLLGDSTFDLSDATSRWAARTALKPTKEVLANSSLGSVDASLVIDQRWIETHSSVVINPAEIQVGDLLVGWEGAELSIGIIVKMTTPPTANSSLSDLMKSIQVVTINKPLQRAVLSTWGGFSLDPGQYHVRKLHNTTAPRATPWVVFQRSLDNLTYQFSRPQEDGVNWIPNTEELHNLGRIQVTTANQDRIDGVPWDLASVIDPNYVTGAPDGNIRSNTVTNPSVFYLVALNRPHREDGIKVSDQLQGRITDASNISNPSLVGVSKITRNSDGTYNLKSLLPTNSRFELKVQDNQLAVVSSKLETTDAMVYDYFALVATSPHPGDDIQIQFTVDGTVTVSPPRLAIYDKKLLWRANLYVDEGGPNDWNNLHPWVTGNEWNRYYKVNDPLVSGVATLAALPTVDDAFVQAHPNLGLKAGGQVMKIAPWSRFTDGESVRNMNKVAYGWGLWDTPFDFDKGMQSQATFMQDAKIDGAGNDFFINGYAGLNWPAESTLAPTGGDTPNRWYNYIFSRRNLDGNKKNSAYWRYGSFTDQQMSDASKAYDATDILGNFVKEHQHKYSSPGGVPKVPGLTTWLAFGNDGKGNPGSFPAGDLNELTHLGDNYSASESFQHNYSSGIDCSGFVSRSAAYDQNSYLLSNDSKTGTSGLFDQSVTIIDGASNPDAKAEFPNLKYAVPGDILVSVTAAHVGIVLSVSPDANGDVKKRSQIRIIQAGRGSNFSAFHVIPDSVWGPDAGLGLSPLFEGYKLKRLTTQ